MSPAEPMLNAVCGNERLREELLSALAENRLPHSVLLTGESGTGTGFAARCLAADYLFSVGGQEARNTADGKLTQIDEKGELVTGIIREVLAVRPVGKMNQINIAQIRTARRECFQSSLSSDGRVILLQGADRMNQSAANALLKVLEEPPEGVLFLLTACSQAAVLPTIRSRCSVYGVAPVSVQECADALLQRDKLLPRKEAEYLAGLFAGRIGSCLRAREPARRAALEKASALYGTLAAGKEYDALVLLAGYEKDKAAAITLLSDLASLCAASLRDPGFRTANGAGMPAAKAAESIEAANAAVRRLSANVSPKLVLTLFVAQLCN